MIPEKLKREWYRLGMRYSTAKDFWGEVLFSVVIESLREEWALQGKNQSKEMSRAEGEMSSRC